MKYEDIINQLSKELNLPPDVVEQVYKTYWYQIRKLIQDLPLKDDINEEQFKQLKTNFNIPSLGKLSVTYDKYSRIKKRFEYIQKIREDAKSKES